MKRILVTLTLACPLFPTGCHNDQPRPREIVILPDLSASIDTQAQKQMFEEIKEVAGHLQRGDTLTIIPIMGDAEADLSGRILHYEVPPVEKREAYDADLRKLGMQVAIDLFRLNAEAAAHPGAHTDILGSVRVAIRTFSTEPTNKRLIILSDFIQDDDQLRFNTDIRLGGEYQAKTLAYELEEKNSIPASVKVVMGRLSSSEFDRLPLQRKLAINAFWGRLFSPMPIEPDGLFALRMSTL